MKHLPESERTAGSPAGLRRTPSICRLVPTYRVGEPFRRGRREWPQGAQLSQSYGGYELTLFRADVDDVADAVRRGPGEFALVVEPSVIVLAYRFGGSIAWSDVPYSWHMQRRDRRPPPAPVAAAEGRSLLWITLVGSEDGMIHAQRGMTLSPGFSRALGEAIRAQAMRTFDAEECALAISRLSLDYPETVDRLSLAVARTMGNE